MKKGVYFSCKKLVLINLDKIFPFKVFCKLTYKIFLRKVPFLANIERYPKFFEYIFWPRAFPDRVTTDIEFIDIPIVKILL